MFTYQDQNKESESWSKESKEAFLKFLSSYLLHPEKPGQSPTLLFLCKGNYLDRLRH